MTKISSLTALTGAGVDTAADLIEIVDTSAATNKKITIAELLAALQEGIDDGVAALLTAGANVTLTYDDASGTLEVAATPPGPGDISGFNEAVDDRVAALLQAGSGIGKVYDDAAGTLTLTATAGSFATTAEVRAGTESNKAIAPDKLQASAAPQTLTDGATVSWDMSLGYNAKVTLGGNRTLAVSNPVLGIDYSLAVIQDGTGSRTVTWPSSFDWGAAGAPTLTTTASKVDQIVVRCTDASTPKFRAYLAGKGFSS